MKVSIIGPVYPYRGGIAHYTTQLATALSEAGHTAQVVSFRRQYPGWLYPGQSDKDPSRRPLRVPAQYLLDPLYPWTWWQVERAIRRFDPSLVAFQWWTTFWAPTYITLASRLRRSGITILYLIHNVLPHEQKPWDRWLARQTLQLGDRFLVHTERENQRLSTLLPDAQAEIVPLPTYTLFNAYRVPKAQARAQLGLPPTVPVALFFGLVRPYKGLDCALQAIARLKEQGKEVHLLVAGEFWESVVTYHTLILQLDISSLVRIENRYLPDEEAALYFSAADLFLAPYRGGTQSAALKAALGFGLPAVVSRALDSRELKEHPAVHWALPDDPCSVAQAIRKALRHPPPPPPDPAQEWYALASQVIGEYNR